jgi:flagellar protein FliS
MATDLSTTRDAYQVNAVMAANPAQLVVMLYDGARRFLVQAQVAMRNGEVEAAHRRLRRGEAILNHLEATLDHEQGAQIAENLQQIYVFCRRHLNRARADRDPQKIDEVVRLLGQLRQSWAELASR